MYSNQKKALSILTTATASPTPTSTATPTPTGTFTPTPTPTATSTPRPTPTPRSTPQARSRPNAATAAIGFIDETDSQYQSRGSLDLAGFTEPVKSDP